MNVGPVIPVSGNDVIRGLAGGVAEGAPPKVWAHPQRLAPPPVVLVLGEGRRGELG